MSDPSAEICLPPDTTVLLMLISIVSILDNCTKWGLVHLNYIAKLCIIKADSWVPSQVANSLPNFHPLLQLHSHPAPLPSFN